MPTPFTSTCSIVVVAVPNSNDVSVRFKGNRLGLLVLLRAVIKAALSSRICDSTDLWSIFNEVTDDDPPL